MSTSPTIRDVAKAAGVSKSTAQRALVHAVRCGEQTRSKVLAAAKQLGYRPDPVFAAIGSRRRRTGERGTPLAYLESHHNHLRIGGPYFVEAEKRAAELGYRLDRIDIDPITSGRRLWSMLYARGFAGAIIGSVRAEQHSLLLENDRFPVVCAGRIDDLPYSTVRPAILSAVRIALRTMKARGYRRIGCAIMRHDPPAEDDYERHAAVLAFQSEECEPSELVPPLRSEINDTNAFLDWFKAHKPEAVLGFHPGMFDWLRSLDIKVPQKVAFASLHTDENNRLRGIAGLDQNYDRIAQGAVNLLDQMIRHGEKGVPSHPVRLEVEATWKDGASLPRRRAR